MVRFAFVITVISCVLAVSASAADTVNYEQQILPIFMEHCAGCHGEEKGSAKLRLHTIDAFKEKIASDDKLLIAGKPDESELYQRLVLPADDKKRMPKKADPLAQEKIDLIKLWIEQGATAVLGAAVTEKPEMPAEEETPKELPLPEVGAAPEEAVQQLADAGAQILPLFAESPLLQVSFALGSEPANDESVAKLAPTAEQVYSLNLAGAQASDSALEILAQLENLTRLHLENSSITDAAMQYLAPLERLQYLNLYGTGITDAGLAHLEGLKHLRKLYLWKTNVSYEVAMGLEEKIPGLQVNLGFDHPVVVKNRLTKELEQVKKQVEETTASEEKLAKELEETRKQKEAVAKRVEEINKELAALEGNPEEEKPAEGEQAAEGEKPAEEKPAEEKPAEEKPKEN